MEVGSLLVCSYGILVMIDFALILHAVISYRPEIGPKQFLLHESFAGFISQANNTVDILRLYRHNESADTRHSPTHV